MKFEEAKHKFISSWGTLGSSWGINKVMAQIHALLLISNKPLSTDEIMEELQISRGNANMNIRSLIEWGIVEKEFIKGERKEFFSTNKDVWELASVVAEQRRKRELEPIVKMLKDLQRTEKNEQSKELLSVSKDLLGFAEKSDKLLKRFVAAERNWFFNKLLKI